MEKEVKGAIFINGYGAHLGIKNSVNRLKEEFHNFGVDSIDILTSLDNLIVIDNGKINKKIKDYDFIIYLDKDKHISKMLEKCGYRLFNSSDSIEICDDKLLTAIALANNGIKLPKTIGSPVCMVDNPDLDKNLDELIDELGLPMIVKENYGSLGNQVYLVKNKEELKEKRSELIYKPHLYQEFIKESSGRDIRVIALKNKVLGAMERFNPNSFKSNINGGGNGKPYNMDKELEEITLKIMEIIGLDYAGLDFVKNSKGEYSLIEVNSNAFFNEFEKTTKINVAKEYVNHILKEIN